MKNVICFLFIVFALNGFAQTIINNSGTDKESIHDTAIVSMLNDLNSDSVRNIIQALQNFGTRFMLSPNRRDIADWLKNKFISVGYPNTVIDSFLVQKTWNGNIYNLHQYNVIATLSGVQNPELVYIIGAHYDSFSQTGDPLNTAPGADDNASGIAAAIEVARVMKKNNYQPASTIQFVAFGAEELMMSPGGCGSCYYATQAATTGQKIQMMINNDMISHATTSGGWIVNLNRYDNSGWLSKLASHIIVDYTSLSILLPTEMNSWSDSRPFYDAGFYAIYFEEAQFSPYYHQPTDIITNYNMPYCAEVSKISCALLVESIDRPVLQQLEIVPIDRKIHVKWNHKTNLNIAGYNVYRSLSPGNNYELLNTSLVQDSAFIDTTVTPLIVYYYNVVSVNNLNQESYVTIVDSAAVPTFNQGVLIVDDSQNELLAPADSTVDNFYRNLFADYAYTHYDASVSANGINIGLLGKYEVVLWHTDRYSIVSKFYATKNEIGKYIKYGGKLILTTDRFAATTDHNLSYHNTYNSGSFLYDIFHVDSFYKTASSRFIGAQSRLSSYPDIHIDTLKTPAASMHHLGSIEAIFNAQGNVIYSYDTKYDSLITSGNMKGLPVGIENMENTGKFILLSFPLWYTNFNDAKAFVDYVMQEKFNDTSAISIQQTEIKKTVLFSCYPNPVNSSATLSFTIPENSFIDIEIFNIAGIIVSHPLHQKLPAGNHGLQVITEKYNNGMYYCVLRGKDFFETTKLVILK